MILTARRQPALMPVGAAAAAVAAIGLAYVTAKGNPSLLDLALVVGGIVALSVTAARPALGLLLLVSVTLLLTRTALFEHGAPGLGGKVKVTDVLIAIIVIAWVVRRELGFTTRTFPARPIGGLMALFFLTVLAAMWTAHLRGTATDLTLQELRPLLVYLLVFPVFAEIRNGRDLQRGLWVVAGVGAIASLTNVVQWVGAAGPESGGDDLTRVLDDAFLGPMVAIIAVTAMYPFAATKGQRIALGMIAVVAIAGIGVTFQRTAWVASMLAVLLVVGLLSPRHRRRLTRGVALGAIVVVLGAAYLGSGVLGGGAPDPVEQVTARIQSIAAFEQDTSAQHRFAEWHEAMRQIRAHPVSGIGLGSGIAFYSPLFRVRTDQIHGRFNTSYIHSSYVWFPLKLGIFGAAAFFALFGVIAIRGLRTCRVVTDPSVRPAVLTALGCLLALAFLSIGGPHLNFDRSTTCAALAMGVLLGAARWEYR